MASRPGLAPPEENTLFTPDGPGIWGQLAFRLLLAYVVFGRLIADIYTLPVGVSLRATDVLLAILLVVWAIWMVTSPQPMPRGAVGVLALSVLVFALVAPYLTALSMTPYEANGAERGLIRVMLFATLFVATYHVAASRRRAYTLARTLVLMTAIQAIIAVFETLTGRPVAFLGSLWRGLGMEVDPNGLRGTAISLHARLTGELRAAATAPHPIVLSAMLAVGVGVCIALYLNSTSRSRRRFYLAAILIQLVSIGTTNSRTGFVALAVIGVTLLITQVHRLPSAFPLVVALILGGVLLAAVSPSTPRLVFTFFTGQETDRNVDVRVGKYQRLPELLDRRAFIGAGQGTSDPAEVLFDNAYLTALVELGLIGVTLIVAFLVVMTARCFSSLNRVGARDGPLLLGGLVAGVALLAAMATFDALSFDQFFPMCLMFLAIGVSRADEARRDETRRPLAKADLGTVP